MAVAVLERRPEPFRAEGLGYRYDPTGLPVSIRADYLHRRHDEFTAELLIERVDTSPVEFLHMARLNLVSTQSRKTLASHLTETVKDDPGLRGSVNWQGLLEQFCQGVVTRERSGSPFYRARELPVATRKHDVIARVLPGSGPTMWFAPQGTGKGWVAMTASAAVASGRSFGGLSTMRCTPLYLDWEDDSSVWQERLTAVAIGMDLPELPDVRYRQCSHRLASDLPSILRYVETERIGLLIVDSVGPAMGASEGMRWDDQTLEFFSALRFLAPLPILLIDHVSGESAGNGPQKEEKAFGSIYKMAEVRAAWSIRKEQETDSDEQVLAFYHRKHNHTKKFPAIGMRLSFESDGNGWASSVSAEPLDVRNSESLSRGLSQPDQVEAYLRRDGPATVEGISEGLSMPLTVARTVAWRLKKRGRVMRFEDGRFALSGGLVALP